MVIRNQVKIINSNCALTYSTLSSACRRAVVTHFDVQVLHAVGYCTSEQDGKGAETIFASSYLDSPSKGHASQVTDPVKFDHTLTCKSKASNCIFIQTFSNNAKKWAHLKTYEGVFGQLFKPFRNVEDFFRTM